MMHRSKQDGGYDTVMHRLFRMQQDCYKIKLHLKVKKTQFKDVLNIFLDQFDVNLLF